MKIIPVDREDYKFLYRLLKERPKTECISHTKMPTYFEHCQFLNKKPYIRNWIILEGFYKVGNMYETERNEIGIHLLKKYQHLTKDIIKRVLEAAQITKRKIYFNVNPRDKRFISILKRNCRLIQHTYENILS